MTELTLATPLLGSLASCDDSDQWLNILKKPEHLDVPVSKKLSILPNDLLHWSLIGTITRSVRNSNGLKGALDRFYFFGILIFIIQNSFLFFSKNYLTFKTLLKYNTLPKCKMT